MSSLHQYQEGNRNVLIIEGNRAENSPTNFCILAKLPSARKMLKIRNTSDKISRAQASTFFLIIPDILSVSLQNRILS